MADWREEFPELAKAYDAAGGDPKEFRRLAKGRKGRPKGSRNVSDAMTRVGRIDPISEHMTASGRTAIGEGCFVASAASDDREK